MAAEAIEALVFEHGVTVHERPQHHGQEDASDIVRWPELASRGRCGAHGRGGVVLGGIFEALIRASHGVVG